MGNDNQANQLPPNLTMTPNGELTDLRLELAALQKQHSLTTSKMAKINNHIAEIKRLATLENPSVTDHAVLRMLERNYGFDTKAIVEQILCPEVKTAIKSGATKLTKDGMEYLFKNGLVVTVINHNS